MVIGDIIGVGLIGTGLSATQHVTALKQVPGVRVVAVAGTSLEKARAFADSWNIPNAYASDSALVADPAVRAIHTCTPPDLRVNIVEACAAAGKDVLVEKPMARTIAEADRLIAICDRAGITLGAMFQNRYTPLVGSLKAAIDAGRLGRLLLIDLQAKWFRSREYYTDSNWRGSADREGGAVLINQAIHSIDLLRWLGGPIVEVQGMAATTLHPIEMEDVGMAMLRFANGAVGSLVATTVAYPGFSERLSFHGEDGTAILVQGEGTIEWHLRGEQSRRETATSQVSGASRDPAATPAHGHIAQFADFYDALRHGRRPLVDGHEGRWALEVVEAIYRSNREKRPVTLPLARC
jgi:UDP-N-acetyl-2-amino-2-deoxyglucuronate dehydrogenase